MPSEKVTSHRARLGMEVLESREVPAWFGGNGGLSVAVGDVFPGMGRNDVIVGTGPGTIATVGITSPTNQTLATIRPFGATYTQGVYVASGDVTGDGQDDLIVATGGGTTALVKVYEFINGGMQLISSFHPFGVNYTGGVDVAVGAVTGDGTIDQIVCGKASSGSEVTVFAYDNSSGTPQYDKIRDFQAYGAACNGITLTVASIDTQANSPTDPYNHDYAEIITGRATALPQVKIFDAQQPTVTLRATYMAFDTSIPANQTGINVVAGDTEGQREAQIYVTLRGTSKIRIFDGETGAILGQIAPFPAAYSKMVNFAIGGATNFVPQSDPFTNTFFPHDLVVVAADHLFNIQQTPIAFRAGFPGRPAGLNGSVLV